MSLLAFFNDLQHTLLEFAQEHIIMGGDLNCVLHDKDKKGGNAVSKKILVIKEIEEIMNLYNLFDIWRNLNSLNFFLISKDLGDLVISCKILNAPETDVHSAIFLQLKSDELQQDKGPGFWKLNNSFLEGSRYVNKLRENIYEYREKYTTVEDLGLKWDLIKMADPWLYDQILQN